MARPRITVLLLTALLAVGGAAACGTLPGGGAPCADGQEGNDPRALSGSDFSTELTRCIDPDADEDVYNIDPSANGTLTVTCTTGEVGLVEFEIDPSVGATTTTPCGPGGASKSVALTSTQSAQVTFAEGPSGTSGEGEGYRLEIRFESP